MQQNQRELKSQICRLTFKFAFVGWLAAAATTGLMFMTYGHGSFLHHLKQFAASAGAMAAVSVIPLLLSTCLASKWVGWIASDEDAEFPTYTKYCYVALFAILITVGGAGVLTVLGISVVSAISSLINNPQFIISKRDISNVAFVLFLGAGYPIVFGVWIEVPMLFLYSHLVRKIVKKNKQNSALPVDVAHLT